MSLKARASRGEPLDPATVELLRQEVDIEGVRATARLLHVAPNVIPRALAGLDILRGSAALIRAGLGSAVPEAEFPPSLYGETAEGTR